MISIAGLQYNQRLHTALCGSRLHTVVTWSVHSSTCWRPRWPSVRRVAFLQQRLSSVQPRRSDHCRQSWSVVVSTSAWQWRHSIARWRTGLCYKDFCKSSLESERIYTGISYMSVVMHTLAKVKMLWQEFLVTTCLIGKTTDARSKHWWLCCESWWRHVLSDGFKQRQFVVYGSESWHQHTVKKHRYSNTGWLKCVPHLHVVYSRIYNKMSFRISD